MKETARSRYPCDYGNIIVETTQSGLREELQFYEVVPNCIFDQFGNGRETQFLPNVGTVRLDSADAQMKRCCNLLVAAALGDLLYDLAFSQTQIL